MKPSLLSVKGAKYNNRRGATGADEKSLEKAPQPAKGSAAGDTMMPSFHQAQQQYNYSGAAVIQQRPAPVSSMAAPIANVSSSESAASHTSLSTRALDTSMTTPMRAETRDYSNMDKYWKQPPPSGTEDLVVIHVCDENQQISRDFCCKRDILVGSMKYFERFLTENENGYDDIDISVHCDVEIFEWLMAYIHEPGRPPRFDKSIIVSILISSEFLQMDPLVELCIQHVASNLNDIIKLPIDLSCISEKLVNKIAYNTHPKTLSETRDRKDKILTKLFKRRVELDFSRKGSSSKQGHTAGGGGSSARTIAASLTCCRHCGCVFLENYVSNLNCRRSPPTIDFRGQLARRHCAIPGWSLTTYLKTLHAGGMGWDAIYWHVWAACIVFRVENVMISALETDRYSVEHDGLLIRGRVPDSEESLAEAQAIEDSAARSLRNGTGAAVAALPPKAQLAFSLGQEDNCGLSEMHNTYKLLVSSSWDAGTTGSGAAGAGTGGNSHITPSLNPLRPLEVLTSEIFELLSSQMKTIVSNASRQIIQDTAALTVQSVQKSEGPKPVDFASLIWGVGSAGAGAGAGLDGAGDKDRRRGRSPGAAAAAAAAVRVVRGSSVDASTTRKQAAAGLSKGKSPAALSANSSSSATRNSSVGAGGGEIASVKSDSDTEGKAAVGAGEAGVEGQQERRSRSSSSTGNRYQSSSSSKNMLAHSKSAKRLLSASRLGDKDKGISRMDAVDDSGEAVLDPMAAEHAAVLRAYPAELGGINSSINSSGMVLGVWLVTHPLELISPSHQDAVCAVSESSLSEGKKMEWELDTLREHDEKRMLRYTHFLMSKRNSQLDHQLQAGRSARTGRAGVFAGAGGGAKQAGPQQKSKAGRLTEEDGRAAAAWGPLYFSQLRGSAAEYYKDRGRRPFL